VHVSAGTLMCAALRKESALYQNYSRYRARDFERRWQTRLRTPPQHLHVVVTHRFPALTGMVGSFGQRQAFPWNGHWFNSHRGRKPVRPESWL
jgi:hypothetical protein